MSMASYQKVDRIGDCFCGEWDNNAAVGITMRCCCDGDEGDGSHENKVPFPIFDRLFRTDVSDASPAS